MMFIGRANKLTDSVVVCALYGVTILILIGDMTPLPRQQCSAHGNHIQIYGGWI